MGRPAVDSVGLRIGHWLSTIWGPSVWTLTNKAEMDPEGYIPDTAYTNLHPGRGPELLHSNELCWVPPKSQGRWCVGHSRHGMAVACSMERGLCLRCAIGPQSQNYWPTLESPGGHLECRMSEAHLVLKPFLWRSHVCASMQNLDLPFWRIGAQV